MLRLKHPNLSHPKESAPHWGGEGREGGREGREGERDGWEVEGSTHTYTYLKHNTGWPVMIHH